MPTLSRDLRRQFEATIIQARRVAEEGARKALEQLAVHHHEPYSTMTGGQRTLRNRLRAHGRQLGDKLDERRDTQTIDRLTQECAYEHWHRMLFARFLAESQLLIEPRSGVAISLDECRELARERNMDWLPLTSQYAVRMLPQIFRSGDPVLEISLPPETRQKLEELLRSLPNDVFTADDGLGWVYQFWQAERKDEVNKSEKKIGADDLAAVTQLFTEDYMVLFLLHNTLGAWWAAKVLASKPEIASETKDEDGLRYACSVGGCEWSYLRFVRTEDRDPWRPAAGTFEGWPRAARDLKLLDPCVGSGHFLVFALPILVAFRIKEEALSRDQAVDAVLRDNLFGLELDNRCTQIAAFNLALAAWRMVGYRPLPALNIACSGLGPQAPKPQWLELAERAAAKGNMPAKRDLFRKEESLLSKSFSNALESLYELFAQAPMLGSLIDPRRLSEDLYQAGYEALAPLLREVFEAEKDDETRERAIAAAGMVKAADLLARKYTLAITNVPYLLRRKQHPQLLQFLKDNYPQAVNDLAIAFADRILGFLSQEGCSALVLPQSFLELRSYKSLRRRLLSEYTWLVVARLGPGAFRTISGEVVNVCLPVLQGKGPEAAHTIWSVDVNDENDATGKDFGLRVKPMEGVSQVDIKQGPEARFTTLAAGTTSRLGKIASASWGISPADLPRFGRFVWEFGKATEPWRWWQSSFRTTLPYAGRQLLLNAGPDLQQAVDAGKALFRGLENWGRPSIVVSVMGDIPCTIGTGEPVDTNVATIVPQNEILLPALWAYCESGEFSKNVGKLYRGLKVTSGTLPQVPFDVARWQKVAGEKYPDGLPEPETDDPTQWLFHGWPEQSSAALHVAVARLLGYRWPAELDENMRLSKRARALVKRCEQLVEFGADDGIVCILPTRGQEPAAERLQTLLGAGGIKPAQARGLAGGIDLQEWLRNSFFQQHCELFQQRPFIWHMWDGLGNGFHALVNYHKLAAPKGEGRRTFEKLIYAYLGDWIKQQRDAQKRDIEGADARVAAAEHLKSELERILEGEPPYDIFVRWKPLHEQPMGWEPDLNDGVRINIRPFMTATTLNGRGKNACILRVAPKIKWEKDRGKEPFRAKNEFPWFWGWDESDKPDFPGGAEFDGNRWNDLHYSRAFKQAARERASSGGVEGGKPR